MLIKKRVLQLDVAVRDALLLVQVTDGVDDLNGPELDGTLFNAAHALIYFVELGTLKEWHDEVKAQLVLKHVVHLAQEGMIDAEHSLHFEERAIDLVSFEEYILSDSLDGIRLLLVATQVGKEDFTESASAYLQFRDEVLQLEGWLSNTRLLQDTSYHFGLLLIVDFSSDCLSQLLVGNLGHFAK